MPRLFVESYGRDLERHLALFKIAFKMKRSGSTISCNQNGLAGVVV